jgi:hypothetical protein
MPRGELDRYETTAGRIVAQRLGGVEHARDILNAPAATHDFDIELTDGRVVALEVTSAADREIEALRATALGREWKAPSLGQHWWLGVPENRKLRVKTLMTGVVPHLEVLEQHDIEEVGGSRHPVRHLPLGTHPAVAEAARGVFALGADRATRLGIPKPGETALVMASLHGGISSNFGMLNELVAECASAKVAKLTVAEADERHLFIWMRPSAASAELAVATLPPPESRPMLPDGIDVVWVATGPSTSDALYGKLWQLRSPGGWENVSAIALISH